MNQGEKLQRSRDLIVRVDSANQVEVTARGLTHVFGPRALAILDAFHVPVTLSEALEILKPLASTAETWMNLTSTVMKMRDVGILVDPAAVDLAQKVDQHGFGGLSVHCRMLSDRARTAAFVKAIHDTVGPEDVVLEIGTGTGVLSIAAAKAGARHVYTIEASAIAGLAEQAFEVNDVADRVTLLSSWSMDTQIPERASVFVSEIIGNEPLSERILESTLDARKRLLQKGARVIPRSLFIYALPVEMEKPLHAIQTPLPGAVQSWKNWYGMDFSPILSAAEGLFEMIYVNTARARSWKRLSEPVKLAEIELASFETLSVQTEGETSISTPGQLNGVIVFFRSEVSPGNWITTDPAEAADDNSWGIPVWLSADPVDVDTSDRIKLRYAYRSAESRDGLTLEVV